MKSWLFAERSTAVQSLALAEGGRVVRETTLEGADSRSGGWALAVRDFAAGASVGRIVCGTGPGSFAGVRAAIAFAHGYSVGSGCEVAGMPSPCAFAREGRLVAAVGDARRGSFWVALFDGFSSVRPVFAADAGALPSAVPAGYSVVTPDAARIGATLASVFGERYAGPRVPLAGDLARAALANPALVSTDPLPVYLAPAVRP